MQDFDKLISLVECEEVREGVALPKVQLHKWLVFGQTDYLCEYGTLGDGHEKFTPAQKYAQSLREYYLIAVAIEGCKASGMEAQADLLDAEKLLEEAKTPSDKLRAMAKQTRARSSLVQALTSVEDKMRMLKFYKRKADSLKEEVEAKYPQGIEQAEFDNWKTVAEYRMFKEQVPGMAKERLDNIPLPPVFKAKLGEYYDRPDAIAPLMVIERDSLRVEDQRDMKKFIDRVENKEVS